MQGRQGEEGKLERGKMSVDWRKKKGRKQNKDIDQSSLRLPSSLTHRTIKLLYAWLLFITAKRYRLRSAKEKGL